MLAEYELKERLFLYYMLFFALISLLTIAGNIASGLDFSFNYKWMGTGIVSSLLFALAAKKVGPGWVPRAGIYLSCFLVMPLCWLSSSGLMSPSVTYSFLLLIMINTLTRGWERLILNGAFILVNLGLILLYGFYPNCFRPFTRGQQILDWAINVPMVFSFAALLLTTFEQAYETEHRKNLRITDRLRDLSHTDALTGLFNRNHLRENWPLMQSAHQRSGSPLSVLLLDIDFFKNYNDTYGHVKGDKCLRAVSRLLLKNSPRRTDFVYRYGGEEFLLFLAHTDIDGAVVVARKIQTDLAEAALPHRASEVSQRVTLSVGICMTRGQEPLEEVLARADRALYRSKGQGRNRICVQRKEDRHG